MPHAVPAACGNGDHPTGRRRPTRRTRNPPLCRGFLSRVVVFARSWPRLLPGGQNGSGRSFPWHEAAGQTTHLEAPRPQDGKAVGSALGPGGNNQLQFQLGLDLHYRHFRYSRARICEVEPHGRTDIESGQFAAVTARGSVPSNGDPLRYLNTWRSEDLAIGELRDDGLAGDHSCAQVGDA